MNSDAKALATLAAAVFYAALLGVAIWPLCRAPLRRAAAFCRRRTIEAIVAAVFTGIAVHCGANKATNGNDRAGGSWEVSRGGAEAQREDVVLRDADPAEGPTNFSFTAYAVTPSNESFAAAWPEWMLPYGSRIELHEKLFSLTNGWTPVREYVVEPGQTNLCDTLSITNGHPSIAFKSLYGDSISITFPGLPSVVDSATGRRLSVLVMSDGSAPVSLPVAVERSERPAEFPPSDPAFAADPFVHVDGLAYDPTNETVTADEPGVFTIATGDQLCLIVPKLSFGSPHSYLGETLRSGSSSGLMRGGNRNDDQQIIVPSYPLDEKCLWEGWHEGTETDHGCSCHAELDFGCDISSCTGIVSEVTVEDDTVIAKVFLGESLVWSNSCEHADHSSSGGRSDYLSSDECSSCGTCADGNCDAFDGPSAGSVRFRVSLGSPSEGHVSGFLWFDQDSVFLPTPSSFSLMARHDAHVSDNTAGGTRIVACSDRGGRTIAVSPIQNGVRLTVTFTATGAPDRTWEITRGSGAMRFRKFNAGGVLMSDASYAPSGEACSVTDNVSGLTEVKSSTGDVLSWENNWSRTVETVSAFGSVTGSHVRVVSEVVGWDDYSVLRETERSEKRADRTWVTSHASYWGDYGSRRNGQPRMVWGDDRAWSWANYDELGRETLRFDQRDGSAAPEDWEWYSLDELPGCDAFATVTDYAPHAGDSCHTNDFEKPRTVSRYVVEDGATGLVSRTWTRYVHGVAANGWPTVSETTIRACSQTAGIADPGNAVSTVVRFEDETSAVPYLLRGEVVSETDEDGVTETHSHTILSNSVVRTVVTRTKGGHEAKTREVRERDLAYGLTLYEATQLTADPGVEFGWRRHTYDSRRRLRSTQYDDGSSETNAYDCCRLLFRVDRGGAKTIHTSTPDQEHLYCADEKVYLAELPKNACYYYDIGSLSAFNAAFEVEQHFYDVFGRETNTVIRPGRYSSNGSTFSWPGGSSKSVVVSYPEGHSYISESEDERGLRTITLRLCCGSSETTVVEEWLPGEDIPDVVTTNVSVRGGMSSTIRVADGHTVESRNYSEYASDGTRLDFSITVSDDCGVVTNSVAVHDFLGRTVCVATPVSCVSNSYDGASSSVLSSFDSVSGTAVTNLYDRLGVDVGSVVKGVATERLTDYELASNALWRVEAESTCAAGATGSVRVVRTRLTGLSDGLRSEFFAATDGTEDEHGFSSYDSDAKDLTETVVSQTLGERTRKSRFGRTIETSSPNGVERMEYDFFGRPFVTSRFFPSLGVFSESEILAYNAFGDVFERYFRHAKGHSSAVADNFAYEEFEYDARGNRTSSANAVGDTVFSSWDSHGRLLEELGDTYCTLRGYDSSGRLVSLSTGYYGDSYWDVTQWWSYDASTGVRTAKTYVDGSCHSFESAADGLPVRATRPDGSWTEVLYDGMRRCVGEDSSDPTCAYGLSLDAFGRTIAATNAFAAYGYVRSSRGMATNETAEVCGESQTLSRFEDRWGRLAGTARASGDCDFVRYGAGGEIASVSNADVVVEYAYDSVGDDIGCRLSLPGVMLFERTLLRDPCRRELIAAVTNSSAVATNAFAYSYDIVGRPVSRNSDAFAYNARGEVASATVAGSSTTYAYDGTGNLGSYSVATGGLPAAEVSFAINALNQCMTIWSADGETDLDYTLNGDMTRLADRGFLYDAKSRLVAAGEWVFDEDRYLSGDYDYYDELYSFEPAVSNRYDHLDRRVQKITPEATHTYFYDGWMLIKEIVANTNGTTDVIEYHWGKDLSGTIGGAGGVGGLLYLTISNSSTPNSSTPQLYIPWYDAYGNVMGYWDALGNVVAEYTYDAFGKTIAATGSMADIFSIRYSTKYFDPETGFYYYGYRYYSPELMRWITRDPIGEEGGVNLYAMCGNNALNSYDRLGMARMLTGNLITADYAFTKMTAGLNARNVLRFLRQLELVRDKSGKPSYNVRIKDFATADLFSVRRDVDTYSDDVYFIAHGIITVNGKRMNSSAWKRSGADEVVEDYYCPTGLDGKRIPLSQLGQKLSRQNTFGCFVSPHARQVKDGVLVSSMKDTYTTMYDSLLARLKRYPLYNRDSTCRKTIIIYEGEFAEGSPNIDTKSALFYYPPAEEKYYEDLRLEYFNNH